MKSQAKLEEKIKLALNSVTSHPNTEYLNEVCDQLLSLVSEARHEIFNSELENIVKEIKEYILKHEELPTLKYRDGTHHFYIKSLKINKYLDQLLSQLGGK